MPPEPDEALDSALESLLLVAGGPVAISALASATGRPRQHIAAALDRLHHALRRGIRLQIQGEHAQLVTAPENIEIVHAFLGTEKPPALSRAALETLTVIAYRQPVTRPEIEAIRGVNSDRAVLTLMARGLIEERGHRAALGRPMQYGTGLGFLEYFGLASLEDLPPLPEADVPEVDPGTIGLRAAPLESGPGPAEQP